MHPLIKATLAVVITSGVALAAVSTHAQGQKKFPNKPIRLVVPFSAGGAPDMLARMIGPKMSENWGQPVVVENRPGAAGMIGTSIVAKAAPDGHTLLLTASAFAISAALHSSLPYDPLKDFAGVTPIGFSTQALVVAPVLGVKSVKDLIALAQAQPGKILFGSSGAGSGTHISAERFLLAAGIKAVHVGFKGQTEFLIEIVTGRVHFGVASLGPALPFIREGKFLALAVSTPQRSPLLAEVPAMVEVLPGWGTDLTQSLLAPAGTPRHILNQISREVARILDLSDVKDRLQSIGFHIATSTPEEHDRILRAQIESIAKVIRAAGLRTR